MARAVNIITGATGGTYSVASTDTAQGLATAKKYQSGSEGGRPASACLITCETNSIRWAIGGTTATTSLGHLLEAGKAIRLTSWDEVNNFSFISATAGQHATLMISVEF